jgi:sigma-B regulation protein RsbU (phosphoserine phosphatase)
MMARTHSLVRSLAARPEARDLFEAPEQAVGLVNAALAENNPSEMFVTFLLATADLARRRLAYVRAGHVPPFWRRADGAVERLRTLGGLPLGMIEGAAYKADAIEFAAGDRILVLTDGFTEAADPAGTLFGEPPIEALLAATHDAPFLDKLTAEVRAFEAGQPASDDMAAVLLRVD